jgi:hypothetical protein
MPLMVRLALTLSLVAITLLALPAVAQARAFYGAIAYADSTGDYGYSHNYRTIEASTSRAMLECQKPSRAQDCVLVKGVGSVSGGPEMCAALTVLSLPGKKPTGEAMTLRWRSVETASSLGEAEEKSMAVCQDTRRKLANGEPSPDAPKCELIVATCSRTPGR